MKKKALPINTMFLILVIALAALGVGYALWSETLTIEGTVKTGEVDVGFTAYDPMECVDTQEGLCQEEPELKDDAAECKVRWRRGNDSPDEDGYDKLMVTVTGMYPSYHCKVSFDVKNLGNVPVHVKLPEPTGDIPAWVATNFDKCYADGMQLHKGESTPICTLDIHFSNDQAPLEGSGPYTFGWTILAHQWNEDPLSDIVDTAVADGRFTTLVAAVQAADLVSTLKSEGPFTVFAPTDDAFAALPEGTLESLLLPENKQLLTDILLYHVVAGKVMAADVVALDGKSVETALAGKFISIKVEDGGVILNDTVNVIITDVEASNGVIHVIDAVLIPPTD
jgi:predicted ribosomally synthesized peptide with SipW-like signal peptide